MALRVGYKASAEQFAAGELLDAVVLAEELGFDSAFVSDHAQPWRHAGGHAPSSLVWLGAAAARTHRITLGTSVLTPTLRYHPAVVAQAFATLADLAPGRVVLGVGTGEALNEVAFGAPWPPFGERLERLREAVALIRELWAGERVSVDGRFYQVRDATVYDRPEQPIPVLVAAGGPRIARYAGAAGDGVICTSGKGLELYTTTLLPAVEEGREQAGARPDFTRMLEVKLSYDPDRERAATDTRFWAPLSLPAQTKRDASDVPALEAAADALPTEEVARRWIVASTPQEVVDALRPYLRASFDHLVFHGPGADQAAYLRRLADEVLPALRQEAI